MKTGIFSRIKTTDYAYPVMGGPSDGQYCNLDPKSVMGGRRIIVTSEIDNRKYYYMPTGDRWIFDGPYEVRS